MDERQLAVRDLGNLIGDREWFRRHWISILFRFKDYLDNKAQGDGWDLVDINSYKIHPGLNGAYGLELEFISSSNRYVIANRINNCIASQNNEWWMKNYNGLEDMRSQELHENPQKITKNADQRNNFDQYSSFFIEAMEEHAAKTHKGNPTCVRRGMSGLKIETDGSVDYTPVMTGVTFWTKNDNLRATDILDINGNNSVRFQSSNGAHYLANGRLNIRQYGEQADGENVFTGILPEISPWAPDNNLIGWNQMSGLWKYNELVTPVLNNEYLKYPYMKNPAGGYYDVDDPNARIPFGTAVIDNFITHAKSHQIVLATQPGHGFHTHLSYKDVDLRNADNRSGHELGLKSRNLAVGFLKIFYIFEPLLFACHPLYRSCSKWCQPLQSIFNYEEISSAWPGGDEWLYQEMTSKEPGFRVTLENRHYIALNLQNITGIGTMEVRIGHSTFNSSFIQAWVNLLQNLAEFSKFLYELSGNNLNMHNSVLNYMKESGAIPHYCMQTSDQYNLPPQIIGPVNPGNPGRPIHGFFFSMADNNARTFIITKLIQTLYMFTNCKSVLKYMIDSQINYYYGLRGGIEGPFKNWDQGYFIEPNTPNTPLMEVIDSDTLGSIDVQGERKSFIEIFENIIKSYFKIGENYEWNLWGSCKMFANVSQNSSIKGYNPTHDIQLNLENACKNCWKDDHEFCINDFNNGLKPEIINASYDNPHGYPRAPSNIDLSRSQDYLFVQKCLGDIENNTYKTQTELLAPKILPVHPVQSGGGKGIISNTSIISRKFNNKKSRRHRHRKNKNSLSLNSRKSSLKLSSNKNKIYNYKTSNKGISNKGISNKGISNKGISNKSISNKSSRIRTLRTRRRRNKIELKTLNKLRNKFMNKSYYSRNNSDQKEKMALSAFFKPVVIDNSGPSNLKNIEKYIQKYHIINAGTLRISLKIEDNNVVKAGTVDWLGNYSAEKKLSKILTHLLKNKVISKELLQKLYSNGYIECHIFLANQEGWKKDKLKKVMKNKFNISAQKLEDIIEVYKKFT